MFQQSTKLLAVLLQCMCLQIFICEAVRVSYSELENLEASCPYYDQCKKRPQDDKIDTVPYYSCQCSKTCAQFNTCCLDSPYINFNAPSYKEDDVIGNCEKVTHSNISTYIISRCAPSWRGGSMIKSKCDNPSSSLEDPMSMAPVTSLKSEITYKNYFCAVCNNDKDSLEMWKIAVSPEESDDVVLPSKRNLLRDLQYNARTNEWGVMTKQPGGSSLFLKVHVNFYVPPRVKNIVRPCIRGMVSECHSSWRQEDTKKKCGSYMSAVYLREDPTGPYFIYRNIHCAICNFESYRGNVCQTQDSVPFAGKAPLSFTLILDVRLGDGDKVGEVNPCNRGEIFDSFFNKCRTLTCALPGYVLRNNKCART